MIDKHIPNPPIIPLPLADWQFLSQPVDNSPQTRSVCFAEKERPVLCMVFPDLASPKETPMRV